MTRALTTDPNGGRLDARLLFVCHDADRTGAPIGLVAFMQWLAANTNCQLATLIRKPGPLVPDFEKLGPTFILPTPWSQRRRIYRRVAKFLPAAWSTQTAALQKIFRAGSYDLVYANTITNGEVLAALAPFNPPVVTHVHELEYWISRAGPANLQAVKSHTHAFIAASGAVRDNLVRTHGIASDSVTVVHEHIRDLPDPPTAAARAAARARLGIPEGAFVVGGCGAEYWRKGRDLIPQLLLTLRRLAPERSFHFVWVGRRGTADEEYSLHYDLTSAGVRPLYHDSGEVENPFSLFAAFDAFALLSRDDPYPLACLESAAMQHPVVCFLGGGGMPEFVRDDCGFAAPYLDLEHVARDLIRLASDPELHRRIGTNGRAKVARENLPAATGPRLCGVIAHALASRGS